MVSYRRDVCGIPLWLMQEYLQKLGGQSNGAGQISGSGWTVRLTQIEDHVIGSLRVGQVRLELEASPEVYDRILPVLEKMLMRAGG